MQVEIISKRGYPVEIHKVTTGDGYILELHRIPSGKGQVPNPHQKKKVAFLQHGFLCSDNVWLITRNDQALGKCDRFHIIFHIHLVFILSWCILRKQL